MTEEPCSPHGHQFITAKNITAKDGIYLDIASRFMAAMLSNPQQIPPELAEKASAELIARIACDFAEALIKESNKRLVGYKGDTFKNE